MTLILLSHVETVAATHTDSKGAFEFRASGVS
jgi:hypothetical protein